MYIFRMNSKILALAFPYSLGPETWYSLRMCVLCRPLHVNSVCSCQMLLKILCKLCLANMNCYKMESKKTAIIKILGILALYKTEKITLS